MPGYPPFVRGAQPLGNALAGWDIRQEHAHPDPAVANAQILEDLDGGVTSIALRLDGAAMLGLDTDDTHAAELTGRDGVSLACVADVERLVQGVKLDIAGFHFVAGGAFLPAASLYVAAAKKAGVKLSELRGGFNADPLSVLMHDGTLPMPLGTALRQMADLAAWTAQNAPRMTAVEVSTTPYHDAGATSVADVAFAVATGIDYLRALTDAGLDVETAAPQITFSMGLGCRFYLATAKIRAARKLWADVIAALPIEAHGIHDALDTGDGSGNGTIVIDVGLDRVELNVGEKRCNAFWMPRRYPHREITLKQVLDDAPAEKASPAEDGHLPSCHCSVPHDAVLKFRLWTHPRGFVTATVGRERHRARDVAPVGHINCRRRDGRRRRCVARPPARGLDRTPRKRLAFRSKESVCACAWPSAKAVASRATPSPRRSLRSGARVSEGPGSAGSRNARVQTCPSNSTTRSLCC